VNAQFRFSLFSWIFDQVTLSKAARRLSPSPYNDVVSNVFHFLRGVFSSSMSHICGKKKNQDWKNI